jgi:putative cell wall-binding protein
MNVHRVVIAYCALLLTLTALPAGAASLPAEDVLEGSVVDAEGLPLAGARVSAVRAGAPDVVVAGTDTAEDGSWALDLEDGSYHVHIADPAGPHVDEWWDDRREPLDAVEISDGDGPTEPLETALAEGVVLRGTVTSPDGPLAGALASVDRTAFWQRQATADQDGRFVLRGLPEGRQTVRVTAPGHAAVVQEVELTAAEPLEAGYRLLPVPDDVQRVSGRERVATAVEASRRGFATARTVVIADAGSFPDALAAAALAAHVDGPLLLVGPRLTPAVVDELRRLQAQDAVVVGAVGAVPLVVQEELRREGLAVRRVAGDSRFDTAALIALEVGAPDGVAIVANGGTFADALSVAPYAAANGMPVLLTGPDRLNVDAAAALASLGVERTIVVGGTGAVADAVLAELPSPQRLAGRTRYDTSLEIARHWAAEDASLEVVSFATGRDYPDALAAGPVAALARGPLLLVDGVDPAVPEATYRYLAERHDAIAGAYAFGGTAVMAPAVLDRLAGALQGDR